MGDALTIMLRGAKTDKIFGTAELEDTCNQGSQVQNWSPLTRRDPQGPQGLGAMGGALSALLPPWRCQLSLSRGRQWRRAHMVFCPSFLLDAFSHSLPSRETMPSFLRTLNIRDTSEEPPALR